MASSLSINPGKGLGFMGMSLRCLKSLAVLMYIVLGGSLHDIFLRLKAQSNIYPTIEVSYSSADPIQAPVVLTLAYNGLRLRFDGVDQRLRLIEVLDFTKTTVTYKGTELIKASEAIADASTAYARSSTGPAFRQVYHKLFGPTFAGEYFPPQSANASEFGTYILSYPGVAFSFAVEHRAWKPSVDFVALLSSSTTKAAHALAIFNGASWSDARLDFFSRPSLNPRSLALGGRGREGNADEIELLKIKGGGYVEVVRRATPSFTLVLGETTPQDLVSQLGPPDAIHRKYDRKMSIHKNRTSSRSNHPPFAAGSPGQFDAYSDTDRSSTHTDYSSPDDDATAEGLFTASTECFYNYFNHGFDVFISHPAESAALASTDAATGRVQSVANAGQLVATKLIVHANVPGSYEFEKYRRSRWVLDLRIDSLSGTDITSESSFSQASRALEELWQRSDISEDERRTLRTPMVLNRDWGDSPASSFEFADLRGSDEQQAEAFGGDTTTGTTQLYGFPRLLFEVLRNDTISCLTVY